MSVIYEHQGMTIIIRHISIIPVAAGIVGRDPGVGGSSLREKINQINLGTKATKIVSYRRLVLA